MENSIEKLKEKFYKKFPDSNLELIKYDDITTINEKYSKYVLIKNSYGICKIKESHLLNGHLPNMQSAIDPLDYFRNQYFGKFPDSKLEILEISNKKVLVKDQYGVCCVSKNYLLVGYNPSINSAVDKLDYYRNQFFTKYPDSTINILSLVGKDKVLIQCGERLVTTYRNSLLFKGKFKLTIRSLSNKTEFYIKKAKEVHKGLYNYDLVDYKNSETPVTIICKVHGEFLQRASSHLNGRGCRKCQYDKISRKNISNNIGGYFLSNWKRLGENSKRFCSFKLYILRLFNDKEEFFKIGRTFQTIEARFSTKKLMPYNYEILKEVKGSAEYIFNLENDLKRLNKENSYIPTKKFNGCRECFSILPEISQA